jgi:hypothetical protein
MRDAADAIRTRMRAELAGQAGTAGSADIARRERRGIIGRRQIR